MQENMTNLSGISRRGLLKGMFWLILGETMTASGILFLPKKSVAYPKWQGDKDMSTFTSETFAELVGESFRIEQGREGKLFAELIEVTDTSGTNQRNIYNTRLESFSILFRAPFDQPLEQKTYSIFHKKTGKFPLFIVPVGIDEKGRLYEAVFNRLKT